MKLPETCAERTRRRRLRQKAGLVVLRVEVNAFAIADALVEAGHLPEWDADDRSAIVAGLERYLAAWSSVTRDASGDRDGVD
jgi:hypothetical protein